MFYETAGGLKSMQNSKLNNLQLCKTRSRRKQLGISGRLLLLSELRFASELQNLCVTDFRTLSAHPCVLPVFFFKVWVFTLT